MKNCYRLLVAIFIPVYTSAQNYAFTKLDPSSGLEITTDSRGVSLADFDKDGLLDIFVAKNAGANRLFRNLGNLQFVDVAADAGVAASGSNRIGVWADYDNDGFADLFAASIEKYHLYHNLGNGTFEEIASTAGISPSPRINAAIWGDVENNAFIDLYTANFTADNVLFVNNRNGTFRNGTIPAGVQDPDDAAMGGAFGDYDNDGDMDLYLVHDAFQRFRLYRNAGYGYFSDVSAEARVNYPGQGMGTVFADFDNDGWLDIYVTNLDSNTVFFNNHDGTFTNTTAFSGVGDRGMGWGIVAFDYDNDMLLDIYVVNASNYNNPPLDNVLYHNLGNRKFEVVTQAAGVSSLLDGWGGAAGDLNDDGYQDLMITNWTRECLQTFINNGGANGYLKVRLTGTTCNRYAIGARVRVVARGVQQIRELSGGSGYLSQDSPILHFGLAQAAQADTVEIYWPGGNHERYYNVAANQHIHYIEGQATAVDEPALAVPITLKLHPSYPNPFSLNSGTQAQTSIAFELPQASKVEIAVFDVLGRRIVTLAEETMPAGPHRIAWDGRDALQKPVSAGIYFVQLRSSGQQLTRKLTLLH